MELESVSRFVTNHLPLPPQRNTVFVLRAQLDVVKSVLPAPWAVTATEISEEHGFRYTVARPAFRADELPVSEETIRAVHAVTQSWDATAIVCGLPYRRFLRWLADDCYLGLRDISSLELQKIDAWKAGGNPTYPRLPYGWDDKQRDLAALDRLLGSGVGADVDAFRVAVQNGRPHPPIGVLVAMIRWPDKRQPLRAFLHRLDWL